MKSYIYPLLLILCACSEAATDNPESSNTDQTETIDDQSAKNEVENRGQKSDSSEIVAENTTEEFDEFDEVDWEEFADNMTKDFSFVILISTKSYDAALERAKDASEKLGYPIDLRGLHANKDCPCPKKWLKTRFVEAVLQNILFTFQETIGEKANSYLLSILMALKDSQKAIIS